MMIPIVIVAFVVGLIVVICAIAATKPPTFRVARSAQINASADKIFPVINEFPRWANWSPYEKRDPNMKKTHSGSANGVGAIYEWDGNNKVGKGRMEILESSAPSKIIVKLDFEKPFVAHNTAEFTLQTVDGVTTVTWAMNGDSPFMHKVMGLFIDMDKMIGNDFAAGLANLKSIIEA